MNRTLPGIDTLVGVIGVTRRGYLQFKVSNVNTSIPLNKFMNRVDSLRTEQYNMFGSGVDNLMLHWLGPYVSLVSLLGAGFI